MAKTAQTELFETIYDSSKGGLQSKTSFLDRHCIYLRFDQFLLAAIVMVFTWVFIYSLGMEAGKKRTQTLLEQERLKSKQIVLELTRQIQYPQGPILATSQGLTANQERIQLSSQEVTSIPLSQEEQAPQLEQDEITKGKYTIQLATYYTMQEAKTQIEKLKERGMNGFVIPSGKFVQLCVNSFKDRQTASSMLSQLKADRIAPADAYVRNQPASI